jgi:hypothetical protein
MLAGAAFSGRLQAGFAEDVQCDEQKIDDYVKGLFLPVLV